PATAVVPAGDAVPEAVGTAGQEVVACEGLVEDFGSVLHYGHSQPCVAPADHSSIGSISGYGLSSLHAVALQFAHSPRITRIAISVFPLPGGATTSTERAPPFQCSNTEPTQRSW